MNTKLEDRLRRKPRTAVQDRPPGDPERAAWSPYAGDGDHRRPTWALVAVAAALIVLAVAIGVILSNKDETSTAPLVLTAGSDTAASCLPFDVQTLAGMPMAFAGTVTEIETGAITIDVDRWYRGGDAQTVRLTTVENAEALLGGIPFEVGSPYLLTASDSALNYCGYSGPATAEFQSSFNSAFTS